MQGTITVRAARPQELPTIAGFWLAMFEEAGILLECDLAADWEERFIAYFSRRIAAGQAQYFVALKDERIAGTAGAMLVDGYPTIVTGLRYGYIFGVRVEPAYRRLGLAMALTRETIAFLEAKRCRRIRLHASKAGRHMYERLGFLPTNEMQLTE